VKSIGEIGGINAVCAHFIEWPENLQGTDECAIGVNSSFLSSRHSAAVTVLWTGEEASRGTESYKPIIRNPDPQVLIGRTVQIES
jgi:hypothetical protein